jgi:hypothetical protein
MTIAARTKPDTVTLFVGTAGATIMIVTTAAD